ncbi:MAG: hypothetical protein P4L84_33000 [Isosphaeraceae bacterium]|nr:hypothetical protein [Isosphaeraceae bacterium]
MTTLMTAKTVGMVIGGLVMMAAILANREVRYGLVGVIKGAARELLGSR